MTGLVKADEYTKLAAFPYRAADQPSLGWVAPSAGWEAAVGWNVVGAVMSAVPLRSLEELDEQK